MKLIYVPSCILFVHYLKQDNSREEKVTLLIRRLHSLWRVNLDKAAQVIVIEESREDCSHHGKPRSIARGHS